MPIPVQDGVRLDVQLLKSRFGAQILGTLERNQETYVLVAREAIVDVARFLKDSPELAYDYFSECLGVDYSTWPHARDLPERFEVVYNLMSTKHYARLFLKVGVDDGQTVPTLKDVYLGAEYPEKEIADLFGIQFAGNELVGERFLLPDDWVGYPLRKEFPLGGEDVPFDAATIGPAVEDLAMPHAGESFDGRTGSEDVSGR